MNNVYKFSGVIRRPGPLEAAVSVRIVFSTGAIARSFHDLSGRRIAPEINKTEVGKC